jgi:hypothetical protein
VWPESEAISHLLCITLNHCSADKFLLAAVDVTPHLDAISCCKTSNRNFQHTCLEDHHVPITSQFYVVCCAVQVSNPEVAQNHVSVANAPAFEDNTAHLTPAGAIPAPAAPELHVPAPEPPSFTGFEAVTGSSAVATLSVLEASALLTEEQEEKALQWAILTSMNQHPPSGSASDEAPPSYAPQESQQPQNDVQPPPAAADTNGSAQDEHNGAANSNSTRARVSEQQQPFAAVAAAGLAAGVAAAATHAVAATAAAVHRCHQRRRQCSAAAERRQRQWEHTAARTAAVLQRQHWRCAAAEARRQRLQQQCNAAARLRSHHCRSASTDTVLGGIAAAFLTPLVQPCEPHQRSVRVHLGPELVHVGPGPFAGRFSCKGRRYGRGGCP